MSPTPPPTFEIELVSARLLAPKVRELVFARVDGEIVEFEAGQWVSLLLGQETEVRRAYSIASAPDGTPRFSLAVTLVEGGPGSQHLHDLKVGDRLRAIGPQGFFTRRNGYEEPALFVATGTGITPLRSMIAYGLTKDATSSIKAPATLLFGTRNEGDILYRDEFSGYEKEHAPFRFVPTLSQGSDAWTGSRGYVQLHVPTLYRELQARSSVPPHVYICGLQKMVSAVRDILKNELGLPRELVHSERYD
ncbi:MAG: FAD-dependent oxidoreductase [Polyangiaceae bacterium]|nr:FAD-dependent oxidoreductase [Polyangiaceae bacterium]